MLTKPRDDLIEAGIVAAISRETLRRILHEGGISWQATKTWKASNDPEFLPKMHRVLDLCDNPPADGRVIRVDEFGPLNLMPRKGKAWRPIRRPVRQRATYTRTQDVRHMLGALDLTTGKITYRIRERKRWPQFLDFLKALRRRWPGQRLDLVMHNYGSHKRPEVRAWCAANNVELVFLPTNASWLNWIECEFTALRYFTRNGADHRGHTEPHTAIARAGVDPTLEGRALQDALISAIADRLGYCSWDVDHAGWVITLMVPEE